MDKDSYFEKSRRLRIPQRCPLVGYCQRWAWTVYFYSYHDPTQPSRDIQEVLQDAGDLPLDYAENKVLLSVEPPEYTQEKDFCCARDLCPEVPLFDRFHSPSFIPIEAISSFSWDKIKKLEYAESKHFSECHEFIQNDTLPKRKKLRPSVPRKLRFQILQRDNFSCKYCGKSEADGAKLHVDHKISVKDGGRSTPENLITACSECNLGKSGSSLREKL